MFYRFYKAHPVYYRLIQILLILSAVVGFTFWSNWSIATSEYTVVSEEIPSAFDGYCILQLSDLHNTELGAGNSRLLEKIKETTPDIIVLTGDIIDAYKTDIPVALDFARELVQLAPTYFVTGNHECGSRDYRGMKTSLAELGVTVLDDRSVTLEQGGASITLTGLDDPGFGNFESSLTALTQDVPGFQILLAHRSERIEEYAASGVDLVFSGHSHGGQIRIPFWGGVMGVYAPGQGFFPKYTSGLHTVENTQFIISRGLGNSRFPFRFNNRPEIVVAQLFHTAPPVEN